jgi:hypothetical protein
MLSRFETIHTSGFWRTLYIVSVLLAVFYIFFDVLDLDGSNFSRLLAPVERSIIAAVSPGEVFDPSETAAHHWISIPDRFIDRSEDFKLLQQARAINLSTLIFTHAHGYRVTLARYFLPESVPDL